MEKHVFLNQTLEIIDQRIYFKHVIHIMLNFQIYNILDGILKTKIRIVISNKSIRTNVL